MKKIEVMERRKKHMNIKNYFEVNRLRLARRKKRVFPFFYKFPIPIVVADEKTRKPKMKGKKNL